MAEDQAKDPEGGTDEARRRLIKAAAVAGGAAAGAALLPGSWRKPAATVGGLPAHAQVSQAITLARASAQDYPFPRPDRPTPVKGTSLPFVHTRSRYDDPVGEFDDDVEVWSRINGDCVEEKTQVLNTLSHFIDGDRYSGTVYFTTTSNCSYSAYIAWTFSKGGRTSNMVNCSILGAP